MTLLKKIIFAFFYKSISFAAKAQTDCFIHFLFLSLSYHSYFYSMGIYDTLLHRTMLSHAKGKENTYIPFRSILSEMLTEIFPVVPQLVTRNQWWRQRHEMLIILKRNPNNQWETPSLKYFERPLNELCCSISATAHLPSHSVFEDWES